MKMARKINKNEKEVIINREAFENLMGNYTYKDIWHEMTTVYGMDITYNALGSMIRGLNTWKLTYAWVLAEILHVKIEDIFILVNVDVEKKVKERKSWQKKYQK